MLHLVLILLLHKSRGLASSTYLIEGTIVAWLYVSYKFKGH